MILLFDSLATVHDGDAQEVVCLEGERVGRALYGLHQYFYMAVFGREFECIR